VRDGEGVSFGDLWKAGTDGQLTLLILGPEVRDGGSRWHEAVPVDALRQLSSDTDLQLHGEDSSLESMLRVRFADQLFVRQDRLSERVGRLTDSGREMVERALRGDAPADRFGLPHVAADPRAAADEADLEPVDALRADHRALLAEREAAFERGFGAGIARLRKEAGLTRAAVSGDLARRLDVPARAAAVKARYADLERGAVPPRGVRRRLLAALGDALGVPGEWLDALRRALPEPPLVNLHTGPAFAPSEPSDTAEAPGERELGFDPVVDDLFFGGDS
jgi:transcriptional regulator with XRE-family HTH domain